MVETRRDVNFKWDIVPDGWVTIPTGWFYNIKFGTNKKADVNAIVILAEVVFNCRNFDGYSGYVSYPQLAEKLNFTKRQIADALKRLKNAGLIKITLTTVVTDSGRKIPNVMLIEPIPEAIKSITYYREPK